MSEFLMIKEEILYFENLLKYTILIFIILLVLFGIFLEPENLEEKKKENNQD